MGLFNNSQARDLMKKCNHKYITIDHRKICTLCDHVKTKGMSNGTIDLTPIPELFFKQTAHRRHQTTCRVTSHCIGRMKKRKISFNQIKDTILTGAIILTSGECIRYEKDNITAVVNPVLNHLITCYKVDP